MDAKVASHRMVNEGELLEGDLIVKSKYVTGLLIASFVVSGSWGKTTRFAVAQEAVVQPPPAPGLDPLPATAEGDVETLLRGPLHEAFAEPINSNARATPVTAKKPPEPIEEIPPEARPTEENAVWIPGYWAWDEDRDDYLWVSGVWRVPPPDRRWVPGYWTEAGDGYQWISGFWTSSAADEVQYLPYPPESLEEGPNLPQPSDDHYWVNGCWMYQGGNYAWRPGFWNTYYPGWVWVPSHHIWTPRGAVFVNGYYDYPFAGRGALFAPAYFHRPIYARPGFYYTPRVLVNIAGLVLNLWVNPYRRHYYWGDYYGPRYNQRGFAPWFEYGRLRGYDPLLAYYRTSYRRQGIDYIRRQQGWHDYFSRHEDRRPPRTFEAQARLAARADIDSNLRYSLLGNSLRDVLNDNSRRNEFRALPEDARRAIARSSNQIRQVVEERSRIESGRGRDAEPRREGGEEGRPGHEGRPGGDGWKLPNTPQFAAPDTTRRPPSPRNRDDISSGRRGERPDDRTATTRNRTPNEPGDTAADRSARKGPPRPGDDSTKGKARDATPRSPERGVGDDSPAAVPGRRGGEKVETSGDRTPGKRRDTVEKSGESSERSPQKGDGAPGSERNRREPGKVEKSRPPAVTTPPVERAPQERVRDNVPGRRGESVERSGRTPVEVPRDRTESTPRKGNPPVGQRARRDAAEATPRPTPARPTPAVDVPRRPENQPATPRAEPRRGPDGQRDNSNASSDNSASRRSSPPIFENVRPQRSPSAAPRSQPVAPRTVTPRAPTPRVETPRSVPTPRVNNSGRSRTPVAQPDVRRSVERAAPVRSSPARSAVSQPSRAPRVATPPPSRGSDSRPARSAPSSSRRDRGRD
jgi:hypothetical protein